MSTTAPQLIGISARMEQAFVVRTASSTVIHNVRAPAGRPMEVEMFTAAEAISALSGPYFFNLRPHLLQVLDRDFFLVSGLSIAGNAVRLYWNPKSLGLARDVKRIDIDVSTFLPTGTVVTEFLGIDPWIMDARTLARPNQLYLVYATSAGQNAIRRSLDGGATWQSEIIFDSTSPLIRLTEANITDPLGTKSAWRALQMRD